MEFRLTFECSPSRRRRDARVRPHPAPETEALQNSKDFLIFSRISRKHPGCASSDPPRSHLDCPIVTVQEDFCGDRTNINCEQFAINPHGRDVGPTWNGIVEFGQKAKPEQKQTAWALNLDCVVAFRGCKDISQILPTVWKLTGPDTVSSRRRSTADSIEEASQPLPE